MHLTARAATESLAVVCVSPFVLTFRTRLGTKGHATVASDSLRLDRGMLSPLLGVHAVHRNAGAEVGSLAALVHQLLFLGSAVDAAVDVVAKSTPPSTATSKRCADRSAGSIFCCTF